MSERHVPAEPAASDGPDVQGVQGVREGKGVQGGPGLRAGVAAAVAALSGLLGVGAGLGAAAVLWGGPGDGQAPLATPVISVAPGEVDPVVAAVAVAAPSVVRVDVTGVVGPAPGNGSGVVVDAAGHAVTNLHVVAGATSISAELPDGRVVDAELVGTDPDHDLALLRLDTRDLPAIPLADAADIAVGQLAVAIGAPFGLSASVTVGVISAVDRPIDIRGLDGEVLRLPSVLQTDAEINPGNSGGPLVDGQGRLLGVTSAILSGDRAASAGIGFAVPVDVVSRTVAALVAEGEVQRARLGIAGRTLSPSAARARGVDSGVLVDGVTAGSPAALAGIAPGDVLVAVDGRALRTIDELSRDVRAAGVGATIVLQRIVADDAPEDVSVRLDAQRR